MWKHSLCKVDVCVFTQYLLVLLCCLVGCWCEDTTSDVKSSVLFCGVTLTKAERQEISHSVRHDGWCTPLWPAGVKHHCEATSAHKHLKINNKHHILSNISSFLYVRIISSCLILRLDRRRQARDTLELVLRLRGRKDLEPFISVLENSCLTVRVSFITSIILTTRLLFSTFTHMRRQTCAHMYIQTRSVLADISKITSGSFF